MKVFISWSGDRSKSVAELLDSWLRCVLQNIKPWLSSRGIDRGSVWFTEITEQLATTKVGIICLTKENLNKPWILFESGAVAKGLSDNRVCTLLIDLEHRDVSSPLSQFNHTLPTKSGIRDLVFTLNNALAENAIDHGILSEVFETFWPKFEASFSDILASTDSPAPVVEREEKDILTEILSSVRGMDRRIRELESGKSEPEKLNLKKNDVGVVFYRLEDGGLVSRSAVQSQINSLLNDGKSKEDIQQHLITMKLKPNAVEQLINEFF